MSTKVLQSSAAGDWGYEVEEGKVKVRYKVKFGDNKIPDSHVKTLEADPGFEKKIQNKTFKWLTGKKAEAAKNADEEVVEAPDPKAEYKKKISELKAENEAEVKDLRKNHNAEIQKLVDSRGEALAQVKELEDEVKSLKADLADFESKKQKEVGGLKKDKKDLQLKVNSLEKQIKDAKAKA